jgi:hypothetical protein
MPKSEKIKVILKSVGTENASIFDVPASTYEITVSRADNLAPNSVEVLSVLKIALSMYEKVAKNDQQAL